MHLRAHFEQSKKAQTQRNAKPNNHLALGILTPDPSKANADRSNSSAAGGAEGKMSGTVKKVADTAVKAGKAIDWDGMAKLLISEEAHRELATLRCTFEDVNQQLQTKFSQVLARRPLTSSPDLVYPSSYSCVQDLIISNPHFVLATESAAHIIAD
jgi:hypothetical protein